MRLGLDEKTGERVALKILKKKEMGVTADVIKQVEREIHAMAQITHVNVIRLKEVQWDATYEKKNGTKLQVILVVLELATGGELFDFLAFTGPFEESIARSYFQQLIAGIAHCHSKGIAHRDLKPEVTAAPSQMRDGCSHAPARVADCVCSLLAVSSSAESASVVRVCFEACRFRLREHVQQCAECDVHGVRHARMSVQHATVTSRLQSRAVAQEMGSQRDSSTCKLTAFFACFCALGRHGA